MTSPPTPAHRLRQRPRHAGATAYVSANAIASAIANVLATAAAIARAHAIDLNP